MAKSVIQFPSYFLFRLSPAFCSLTGYLLTMFLVVVYPWSYKLILFSTQGIRSVPPRYSLVLEETRSLLDFHIGLTMRVIGVHVLGEVEGYDYKLVILSRGNMKR